MKITISLYCLVLLGLTCPASGESFSPVTEVIPADTAYAVIWRSHTGPADAKLDQKSPQLQAMEYLGATMVELTTGVKDFSNFGADLAGEMAVFASPRLSPILAIALMDENAFNKRMEAVSKTAEKVTTSGDVTTLRFKTIEVSYTVQKHGWTRYAFVLFHDGSEALDTILTTSSSALAQSEHLETVLSAMDAKPDVLGLLNTQSLDNARLKKARDDDTAWDMPLAPSKEAKKKAKAARKARFEACEKYGNTITNAMPVLALGEIRKDDHITLDLVAPISLEGRIFLKALLPSLTLKGTQNLFNDSDFTIAFQVNFSALKLVPSVDATVLSTCPNLGVLAGFMGAFRDRVLATNAADVFTGPIVLGVNTKNLFAWVPQNALVVLVETALQEDAIKGFGILLRELGYNVKSVWGGGASKDAKEYNLPADAQEGVVKSLLLPFTKYISMTKAGESHVVIAGGMKEPNIEKIAEVLSDEPAVTLPEFASIRITGSGIFQQLTSYIALHNIGDRLTEGAKVTFVERFASIQSMTITASVTDIGLVVHSKIVQAPAKEDKP